MPAAERQADCALQRRWQTLDGSAGPIGGRRSLGVDDADVVGFIGSFYDYEGLDDLIAAMPPLLARRPKARLLLVGGGPMEAALKAQAAASLPVARSSW